MARGRSARGWTSMENVSTWPSRKLASDDPVPGSPGRSVNNGLKRNRPVGEGGCTMSSRCQRQSRPTLRKCWPRCHESTLTTCATSVRDSLLALTGGPSCCRPAMANVGSAVWNAALEGSPGMPSGWSSSPAERVTARRV